MTARGVSSSVAGMEGVAALPRSNGELVFEAPWQGRVLALALGVVDHFGLDWEVFRQQLIAAVAEDAERPYYESFTAALESLVAQLGIGGAQSAARARFDS